MKAFRLSGSFRDGSTTAGISWTGTLPSSRNTRAALVRNRFMTETPRVGRLLLNVIVPVDDLRTAQSDDAPDADGQVEAERAQRPERRDAVDGVQIPHDAEKERHHHADQAV